MQNLAKWRSSASLIVLAKNSNLKNSSNYNVLLFNRSEKASFMPQYYVFPGGVTEVEDESPLWLEHFRKFGVTESSLHRLCLDRTKQSFPVPDLFANTKSNALPRDISLRITAIRETFEEVGLLLCRNRKVFGTDERVSKFGQYSEGFGRRLWQQMVHNDAGQFLKLCQELDVVPDIWSLHEWSVWLTPAFMNKRFQTVFYVVGLEDTPNLILDKEEGTDYKWESPETLLNPAIQNPSFLAPPQFYELSRMQAIPDINKFIDFAISRSKNGAILMLPMQVFCIDGAVSIYPGDSKYSDYLKTGSESFTVDKTQEDFRKDSKHLHRVEHAYDMTSKIFINIQIPDGQLVPINCRNVANL